MIINIPINVDEDALNKAVAQDYAQKIEDEMKSMAMGVLAEKSYYGRNGRDGMKRLVEEAVNNYIKEWKDEIVDKAADNLAARLARTKAAKNLKESKP